MGRSAPPRLSSVLKGAVPQGPQGDAGGGCLPDLAAARGRRYGAPCTPSPRGPASWSRSAAQVRRAGGQAGHPDR